MVYLSPVASPSPIPSPSPSPTPIKIYKPVRYNQYFVRINKRKNMDQYYKDHAY